ncbi:MAG: MarR family winged helix-turn-helix transcriptional regulator, partial [Oscillospiraceae bacterium]|nr:MarR family winged helix-turn-helix transcriptional regulator [Oscillospiraceae bacterium]
MDLQGISKLDLKKRNRMQILRVIKECGPISRVDIASSMKITRAAVTIITNEMITEGVLYEVGEAPVSLDNLQKGRRKILIDINENYKFSLGASISDEMISVGLTNLNGKIMDKTSTKLTSDMTSEDILEYITCACKNIMQNSCLEPSKIVGLGIGIQTDMCSKMKVYFKDGKLDYSPVSEVLSDKLGIDVICSNLSSALALANQAGDIKERKGNYAFIHLGKHVNLSILVKNEIMQENINYTNHVENMIVNPGGKKLDGYPDGSVKAELTTGAIIDKYREVYSKENTPIL